jgi:hypothetical protein
MAWEFGFKGLGGKNLDVFKQSAVSSNGISEESSVRAFELNQLRDFLASQTGKNKSQIKPLYRELVEKQLTKMNGGEQQAYLGVLAKNEIAFLKGEKWLQQIAKDMLKEKFPNLYNR